MPRSIMRGAAVAAFGLILAACGGDSSGTTPGGGGTGEPPETVEAAVFAEGLCTAVTDFQNDLEAESTAFQEALSAASPEDVLDGVAGFLGTASDRSQQAADEIVALGVPDVSNGEEVVSTFVDSLQQLADLFAATKAEVEGLSSADPEALAAGLTQVGEDLTEAGTAIGSAFADLESPDLDSAAADVPACAGLI